MNTSTPGLSIMQYHNMYNNKSVKIDEKVLGCNIYSIINRCDYLIRKKTRTYKFIKPQIEQAAKRTCRNTLFQ